MWHTESAVCRSYPGPSDPAALHVVSMSAVQISVRMRHWWGAGPPLSPRAAPRYWILLTFWKVTRVSHWWSGFKTTISCCSCDTDVQVIAASDHREELTVREQRLQEKRRSSSFLYLLSTKEQTAHAAISSLMQHNWRLCQEIARGQNETMDDGIHYLILLFNETILKLKFKL